MGRVVNWIYGLVVIFLALDALKFEILPSEFLPVAVIIMGALIAWTPLGDTKWPNRPGVTNAIRYILGPALIVMGIFSYLNWSIADLYNIHTLAGQWILIGIGVIYLFSGTQRSQMPIQGA